MTELTELCEPGVQLVRRVSSMGSATLPVAPVEAWWVGFLPHHCLNVWSGCPTPTRPDVSCVLTSSSQGDVVRVTIITGTLVEQLASTALVEVGDRAFPRFAKFSTSALQLTSKSRYVLKALMDADQSVITAYTFRCLALAEADKSKDAGRSTSTAIVPSRFGVSQKTPIIASGLDVLRRAGTYQPNSISTAAAHLSALCVWYLSTHDEVSLPLEFCDLFSWDENQPNIAAFCDWYSSTHESGSPSSLCNIVTTVLTISKHRSLGDHPRSLVSRYKAMHVVCIGLHRQLIKTTEKYRRARAADGVGPEMTWEQVSALTEACETVMHDFARRFVNQPPSEASIEAEEAAIFVRCLVWVFAVSVMPQRSEVISSISLDGTGSVVLQGLRQVHATGVLRKCDSNIQTWTRHQLLDPDVCWRIVVQFEKNAKFLEVPRPIEIPPNVSRALAIYLAVVRPVLAAQLRPLQQVPTALVLTRYGSRATEQTLRCWSKATTFEVLGVAYSNQAIRRCLAALVYADCRPTPEGTAMVRHALSHSFSTAQKYYMSDGRSATHFSGVIPALANRVQFRSIEQTREQALQRDVSTRGLVNQRNSCFVDSLLVAVAAASIIAELDISTALDGPDQLLGRVITQVQHMINGRPFEDVNEERNALADQVFECSHTPGLKPGAFLGATEFLNALGDCVGAHPGAFWSTWCSVDIAEHQTCKVRHHKTQDALTPTFVASAAIASPVRQRKAGVPGHKNWFVEAGTAGLRDVHEELFRSGQLICCPSEGCTEQALKYWEPVALPPVLFVHFGGFSTRDFAGVLQKNFASYSDDLVEFGNSTYQLVAELQNRANTHFRVVYRRSLPSEWALYDDKVNGGLPVPWELNEEEPGGGDWVASAHVFARVRTREAVGLGSLGHAEFVAHIDRVRDATTMTGLVSNLRDLVEHPKHAKSNTVALADEYHVDVNVVQWLARHGRRMVQRQPYKQDLFVAWARIIRDGGPWRETIDQLKSTAKSELQPR